MESNIAFAEEAVRYAVQWLKLGVEVAGAVMIGAGVITALIAWTTGLRRSHEDAFGEARLKLARYLAMALELALGADILATAISPTWDQIGKLAAIAIIRTALNYFLQRELREGALRAAAAGAGQQAVSRPVLE